uniref:Uncharacterized protein n=2 Tax=Lygus hesperus TaxID=30085 RepID=A0A146LAB2_LYGHE
MEGGVGETQRKSRPSLYRRQSESTWNRIGSEDGYSSTLTTKLTTEQADDTAMIPPLSPLSPAHQPRTCATRDTEKCAEEHERRNGLALYRRRNTKQDGVKMELETVDSLSSEFVEVGQEREEGVETYPRHNRSTGGEDTTPSVLDTTCTTIRYPRAWCNDDEDAAQSVLESFNKNRQVPMDSSTGRTWVYSDTKQIRSYQ